MTAQFEVRSFPLTEACDRLGIGIVKGYDLIKHGEIQSFLIGRRRYVTAEDLQDFIRRQIEKSLAETPTERAEKVTAAVDGRARKRDERVAV